MGDTLKSWLLLQLDTTLDSLNNHAGSLISLNSFLSLNSNPKRVQISQLSNISDSSLSCIVSDKVLLISSVITADAALTLAEALVNENKPVKKLSGGIFLIKKFKFLLHDEKDMLSIKLIIHDLEYIGSEGCNLFGDPKTISSFPSIKQKLLDLDKSIQVGTIIVENSGGPRRYKIGQHPQWKDSFDFEVPIDEREKLNELLPGLFH